MKEEYEKYVDGRKMNKNEKEKEKKEEKEKEIKEGMEQK